MREEEISPVLFFFCSPQECLWRDVSFTVLLEGLVHDLAHLLHDRICAFYLH